MTYHRVAEIKEQAKELERLVAMDGLNWGRYGAPGLAEAYGSGFQDASVATRKLAQSCRELVAEVSKLREALAFYADKDRYCVVEDDKKRVVGILESVPGATARAALEGK